MSALLHKHCYNPLWRTVKAGIKAKVECLARPHLTACICKVDQASSNNSRDPQGLRRRQLTASFS